MSEFRKRLEQLSPRRLMLLALELQQQVEALKNAGSEPIAITGIGCRLPGGVDNAESFWEALREGRDAVREIPPERWPIEQYYDSDPDVPGKMATRWAGLLDRVDGFDAPFFGVSRREAVSMDPQHRLAVEVSWEALEDAGIAPGGLRGSAIGVFLGISTGDYQRLLEQRGGIEAVDAYAATGNSHSMAAGRISYLLGLSGPSMVLDTACSSSLVAVHLACQSLRRRECRMALAGGVNLILSPESTIALSRSHMMAADGRCKTFDAAADGFVRGEGCGIVVLKCLTDALADGDTIRGVIRGSAVNQDGRSNGITAPSGAAQEAVIRAALADAHMQPEEVHYVEAHGTGTSLGDPIEVQALVAVLGKGRAASRPLVLGSVKTNLGHLEAAAGIAGLIKAVLAIERGAIPPHLHFRAMNPHIELNGAPVVVPKSSRAWPEDTARVAGVSSFGFSGTNAHVIVEAAPAVSKSAAESDVIERPWHVFTVSARSAAAARTLVERYRRYLDEYRDARLADVCFTANAGRTHEPFRLAYVVRAIDELRERLKADRSATETNRERLRIAFLFSGHDLPAGAVDRLYATQPMYRKALRETVDRIAAKFGRNAGEADYALPPLFAVQYALVELWRSWGIEPDFVVGYGDGRFAAAFAAGVIRLEQAIDLIGARGESRDVLRRITEGIDYRAPRIPMFTDGDVATVDYWIRPANKDTAPAGEVIAAFAAGARGFLEIGAGSLLDVAQNEVSASQARESLWMASLAADSDDGHQILEVIGRLYEAGVEIDWAGFDRPWRRRRIPLPTYPFERQRYWIEERVGAAGAQPIVDGEALWTGVLNPVVMLWLTEHRVRGQAILTLAAYLEIARLAARASGLMAGAVTETSIERPLHISSAVDCAIEVRFRHGTWELFAMPDGGGKPERYATGRLSGTSPKSRVNFDAARAQAKEPIDVEEYYRRLAERGVEFGPAFRTLLELHGSADCAIGRVRLNEELARRDTGFTSGLHPALLDGCLQVMGAALDGEWLYLPTSIEAFAVQAEGHTELWSYAAIRERLADGAVVDLAMFDLAGQVVATIDGLHLRAAADNWVYQIRWQNQPLMQQVAGLARPDEFVTGLDAELDRLSRESGLHAWPEARISFDRYCAAAVLRALRRLGWSGLPGDRFPLAAREHFRVLPQHEQLFGRLLRLVEKCGWLQREGGEFKATASIPAVGAVSPAPDSPDRLFASEWSLLVRCGEALSDVLCGATDPLQLLFEDGNAEATAAVYRSSPGARTYNELLRVAIEKAISRSAANRKLRTLEIGGGTGGSTSAVLAALPRERTEYVFTDISPLLANRGAETFRGAGCVRGQVMDIEKDPVAQGFEAHSFDVIVAANVLHATANIDETLRNVHTLLAPGGLVFLLEKTEPEWWIDLTFGLLDGWWRFRDFNRRPDYPLLDSATWTAALEEAGFEETAATEGPQGALIIAGMPAKTRLKRWLVQSDDDGLRNALKARLEARGAICQVACDAVADGVIFIAPRNLAGSPATTATGLFAHALDLSRTAQRLWIVTHGVHEGTSDGAVAQAALWGFARTFALEQPGRWGAIVDLDPSEPFETQAEELAAELFNTGDEDQVMLRGGERRVARLARQHSVPAAPFRCRADASYLVTGGLGGIGLVLAKWLIGRGARHLCLVGRTVLPPRDEWDRASDAESRRRIEGIRAIEQAGATVDVVSADVADHEQMRDVLRRFGGQLPPLGGVVHAAAHFRYDELDAMDPSALRSVLHPKAAGAWNLHELTRDLPLEFFVMSSSTASVIGSRGLAHYAAANQFLDALAIRRHTLGLPATSVVWGTWNEMRGATVEERERYLRSGLRPMNSTAALDALGDAIASGEPVRMVADIDWSLLKPAWEARRRRPLLELLGSGGRIQRETPTGGKPPGKETPKARALAGMTAPARERFCMDLVSAGVAQVLGLGPSESLDPDIGFFDLGMDSLMSQELRRRLEEGAGRSLPASAVFNYPNARALARFLAREESPVNTPPAVPIVIATDFVSEKPASEESLDDLSEEDLERELAQRLQTLR